MKLWDVIKICTGILVVKSGCKIIDTIYVYLTDDRTRSAFFNATAKDNKPETIDTEEIEEDAIIGFKY